ncbi:uncharacterized protein LOC128423744 isoform X1 [Podarcis raffonei]|uniref:uncharacterized protein LOC128423744 isoform X1 n=1 Tax=Podarcis raffonei TaxID=65483 RepID=UPI002329272A|nr:uncharacterized protein LOC128423744 isoform X1 [Podarcis raffonei]
MTCEPGSGIDQKFRGLGKGSETPQGNNNNKPEIDPTTSLKSAGSPPGISPNPDLGMFTSADTCGAATVGTEEPPALRPSGTAAELRVSPEASVQRLQAPLRLPRLPIKRSLTHRGQEARSATESLRRSRNAQPGRERAAPETSGARTAALPVGKFMKIPTKAGVSQGPALPGQVGKGLQGREQVFQNSQPRWERAKTEQQDICSSGRS